MKIERRQQLTAREWQLVTSGRPVVRRILGSQADPRLATVEEVGKKALAKRDEVESAQSLEELEGISWT